MSSGSSLVVPMVLWGRYAPTHCVSAILMTPDGKYIVTGCNDGQIVVWDVLEHFQVAARNMLFGHTAAISCLAMGSEHRERCYIVSSSENGEMCLWDVSDGRCIENNKMDKVHSDIAAYHLKSAKALRLVCNGYYDEIVIIDPLNLEIVYLLVARVESDWISACCIITPPNRDDDVILAITNSGTVKVWTLTSPEPKGGKIPENESKQIRCLNAQTLRCCPGNLRTVLIVCSKYWQVYNFASRKADKPDVIYDASDFTLLCSESNRRGERWMGGDFLGVDRVIVWSNEGRGYLYKLPTNANADHSDYHKTYNQSSVHAYYVLDTFSDHKPLDCSPALTYVTYGGSERANHLLLRGDSDGRVTVWVLPQVSEKQMTLVRQESFDRLPALSPKSSTTLQDSWNVLSSPPPGILDGLFADNPEEKEVYVTATIFIPSQGRLVCGRSNGTIIIVPAIDCIKRQLLVLNKPVHITPMILSGHHGRVTCLLYPFNEATRYEPHHLLSGGTDFSVILWDVEKGSKIYVFTVHGGSLTQITVPPANCNPRILSCVCSVAGDHSVALLSLKERKCLLLASRHLYPVKMIKWRPLDDFMLVQTKDGVVTVWQMETGHLDRVIDGKTAEDVLSNCDENATPVEALTNPSITLAQALKRRNLATFRNLAQQKLNIHTPHNLPNQGIKADFMKPTGFPLLIQGVKTNTRDPDAHVLFFDTEALIVHLLTEEYAMLSPAELEARGMNLTQSDKSALQLEITDAQQKLAGFLTKAKEKAENMSQKFQAKIDSVTNNPPIGGSQPSNPIQTQPASSSQRRPESIAVHESLSMAIGELFMSCLHAWSLDPQLDDLCLNKLGLHKPKCPISFGLLSHRGHMSLMLPGWHRHQNLVGGVLRKSSISSVSGDSTQTLLHTRMGAVPFDSDIPNDDTNNTAGKPLDASLSPAGTSDQSSRSPKPSRPPPARRASSVVSYQQQAYDFSTKLRWQISSAVTTQHLLSVISVANTLMGMSRAVFLPELLQPLMRSRKESAGSNFGYDSADSTGMSEADSADAIATIQAQIKQGWSLLAALHCVLLPELVGPDHYQSPQLEMLARRWQDRCLEIREAAQALLLAELRRIKNEGRKKLLDKWAPFLPSYVDPELSLLSNAGGGGGGHKEGDEEEDDEEEGILAGDIPAHKLSVSFESRRKQATAIVMLGVIGAEFGQEMEPSRTKPGEETKKTKGKGTVEGFSLSSNYSLARHTSKALMFLLLQPPSPKLPAYTPIRRAAIDLIGRGFTVWEPYLDVSSVLLGLLELSIDSNKLIPSTTYGLPLSPAADACRTARHALSLIATARPPAFIITMAKEVARYNALAQNAQHPNAQMQNIILVRASAEILHIIELLVEKIPNDVADLIVEAMDVTMFCLDLAALKAKGLPDLFPAICRFSMVAYCPNTKRVWVGAKNGHLALYELKQHAKCQMISAHHGAITAVSVNQDGKYLATFSHVDNKLKFWQTASTSLFGIGSQQTKQIRSYSTPAISVSPVSNILKLVRLVWIDKNVVVLLTVDGQELKYSV